MAPVTRSQTRNRLGELAKYVMEQPTVIENIIRKLNESSIEETYFDLFHLKLVFKSERTVDVINPYFDQMRGMYIQKIRIDQFEAGLKEIMKNKIQKLDRNSVTEESFIMILDYIIMDNFDVMKLSCMRKFRDVVYSKIIEYYNFDSTNALKYLNEYSKIKVFHNE